MGEWRVGTESELRAGSGRHLVEIEGREVGIFSIDGELHAYESRCPHQGGPVCRGVVMARVEGVVAPDGTLVEERYASDTANLVCPWHGFEFDLKSGQCVADPRFRLRAYEVTIRDGDVYVMR